MTGVVLFAGGGLACHGLKEAGIDLQLGVEWEADAVTVAQATGLEHVIEGDVRDPELRQRVERPGLLWSSFPCQAWSTAGKRLGAQDERNGWPWTVDWIDQVQPRWFIAENVRGLTFHRGAADCDDGARPQPNACPRCYLEHVILPQLRERFEWVDCRVLNSADFGTPQHRRRLFIVAGPRRISWPAPTHSEGGDLWTKPWRSMGEALGLPGRSLEHPAPTQASTAGHGCGQISADAATRCRIEAEFQAVTGRRRLTVQECRVLMRAPRCYDAALDLVTTTAAYRILCNGVDRQLSRLLALAVLAAEQEAQCDTAA